MIRPCLSFSFSFLTDLIVLETGPWKKTSSFGLFLQLLWVHSPVVADEEGGERSHSHVEQPWRVLIRRRHKNLSRRAEGPETVAQ